MFNAIETILPREWAANLKVQEFRNIVYHFYGANSNSYWKIINRCKNAATHFQNKIYKESLNVDGVGFMKDETFFYYKFDANLKKMIPYKNSYCLTKLEYRSVPERFFTVPKSLDAEKNDIVAVSRRINRRCSIYQLDVATLEETLLHDTPEVDKNKERKEQQERRKQLKRTYGDSFF
uniref:Uncharacterized protein n=1 Tax=Panagrolaimus davidi TaxID=227884 RepID=A0A914Q269_9BILA